MMGYRENVPAEVEELIAAVVKALDSNEIRRMRYGIDDLMNQLEQETRDYERWPTGIKGTN